MKPATLGKRSGPVQMRLFRISGNERVRERNTTPSPTLSQPNVKTPPSSSPHSMSELPEHKETTSTLRADGPGSLMSSRLAPTSAPTQLATVSDLTSPSTEETMATPNTLRSVNEFRSPKTPASETSEGWSAVGKATISGRSGRVIERLQSDLDQAKRDNKSLQLSNDELRSSYGLLAAEVGSLRDSAETNETIVANLQAQAGRKDRKITELKEDLAEQKILRLKAETAYNNTVAESERLVNEAQRERAKAVETAKHHQIQYEVLSKSMMQLRGDYEQKIKTLSKKATDMLETMREDQRKLSDYEAEAKKQTAAIESVQQMNDDLAEQFEKYKAAQEEEVSGLMAEIAGNREKMSALERACLETVGSMKQVMSIKTTFKGEFNE